MNPLFKQSKQTVLNMNEIKNALKQQDNSFYEKMIRIARQRGISEEAIKQGMDYINTLRY